MLSTYKNNKFSGLKAKILPNKGFPCGAAVFVMKQDISAGVEIVVVQ